MKNLSLIYIYNFVVFFIFFFFNYFILFLSEETFIGFFMMLFFYILFFFLKKIIKFLFFHIIEQVYFTFYLLLDVLIFISVHISKFINFLDKKNNLIYFLESFELVFKKSTILFLTKIADNSNDFFLLLDFCSNDSIYLNNFFNNTNYDYNLDLDYEFLNYNFTDEDEFENFCLNAIIRTLIKYPVNIKTNYAYIKDA